MLKGSDFCLWSLKKFVCLNFKKKCSKNMQKLTSMKCSLKLQSKCYWLLQTHSSRHIWSYLRKHQLIVASTRFQDTENNFDFTRNFGYDDILTLLGFAAKLAVQKLSQLPLYGTWAYASCKNITTKNRKKLFMMNENLYVIFNLRKPLSNGNEQNQFSGTFYTSRNFIILVKRYQRSRSQLSSLLLQENI